MNDEYCLGFSEFTTWPWSFREDLEHYAQAGVFGIEVCEFKLPHKDFSLLAQVPEAGLRVCSVQMHTHSVFVDSMAARPENPADRLDEMKHAIDASSKFVPKQTPFVVISGIAPDGNIKAAADRTVETLKELAEFAAEREMRIAFEPLSPVNLHTDTAIWGLDQGLEIVDRVNHPAAGVCVDSWNVWQTPNLERVIEQCGKKIFLVQLSDWRTPRSTADRFSLGEGVIPLEQIVRAIRRTGYAGAWVVEILSSFHLPGSLWKSDLDAVLQRNIEAFDRIWNGSLPNTSIVGEETHAKATQSR